MTGRNRFSGWDPGLDMSDDDLLTAEAGSMPPLRGYAHSKRCIQQADRADKAEAIARELRLFARHDESCYFARTGGPCDCGFDEVLDRFDAEYSEEKP